MTEVNLTVIAEFDNEDSAKDAVSRLKASAKKNDHELNKTLNDLYAFDDFDVYNQFELNIENISKKKNKVTILVYAGRIEPATWFSCPVYQLGAKKIYIREQWDEGGSNYYFLNGKKVSKKKFDGDKPKKPLTKKDIEINKNLFLPEGRVHIKATLLNHWDVGDIYESILMEFITDDGNKFYHKATGQLKKMSYDDAKKDCEFNAVFERGKHNGEFVSFAKRPTKVIF